MAWERSFEKKVLKVREKELKYQARHYRLEVLWGVVWNGSPILVTLVAFWHYAIVRQQPLTPSVAFTSVYHPIKQPTTTLMLPLSTDHCLCRDEICSQRAS
jgi:hypothetical protein